MHALCTTSALPALRSIAHLLSSCPALAMPQPWDSKALPHCSPLLRLPGVVPPPGATALDKKSRKKFEAEQLARLGAKAEARPRMAASIGHGMAKKQAQRAERALQEGIAGAACAAGLVLVLDLAVLSMAICALGSACC